VNGGMRQAFVSPRLGERAGHIVSTLILCFLIALVAWLVIGWIAPVAWRHALLIGLVWLALTLAFEFLAGHYLFGNPWAKILADYNVFRGRIWLLVLATCVAAPVWAYWLQRTD